MGCCQGWESPQSLARPQYTRRSASLDGAYCYSERNLRGNSLAELIEAGYHERTLSAASFDLKRDSEAQIRALAIQDALKYGHFLDPKARELEDYIVALQFHPHWDPLWALEGVLIDSLHESQFCQSQPVLRMKLHIDRKVRLSFLLAMIENPDIRARWDYSLQHIKVEFFAEDNYYIRDTVMWTTSPLVSREFVEKCQVRDLGKELRLVYYSVTQAVRSRQDSLKREGVERVETIFGMLQLQDTGAGVDLTLTYQLKEGSCKEPETEIHTLYDWAERLLREIELTVV